MKLITRNTDYALRAVCSIAKRKGKIVTVSELVAALKMPRPFLRKLLQNLNKKGILKSYKGLGGGFVLARPPEKIFLLDLISIFQGELSLNECLFKRKICPNVRVCPLKNKLDIIEQYVIRELKTVTIGSLLK